MKQIRNKIATLFVALLLFQPLAQAEGILVSSGVNQTFDKNQATEQLRDITITDDATNPLIKAGVLKITIPDEIEIIFNSSKTAQELVFLGTAVTNGKVGATTETYFQNDDKTLVIPISADFSAGEQLIVSKVYVEGFHNPPAASSNIVVQVNSEASTYEDAYYIDIQISTNEDNYAPDLPTGITLENTSEGTLLTWTDPTDLDLQKIQILRGISPYPVNGTPLTEVLAGEQEFLDNDVAEGDLVTYILRATDGPNVSSNSEEFIITYVPTEPEPEPDPEPIPEPEPDPVPEPEPVELTDIEGHWAQVEIEFMAQAGIVLGNPDGTFLPDNSLNRAETAALLYRFIDTAEPTLPGANPFPDVDKDEWYAGYVQSLLDLNLIYGNPDGTFQPSEMINRAEFLHMALNLYDYVNEPLPEPQMNPEMPFEDVPAEQWYTDGILKAAEAGFVEGTECGDDVCFNPADEITRAEATKILYNMFADSL